MRPFSSLVAAAALTLPLVSPAAPRIQVEAKEHARHHAITRFEAPPDWRAFNALQDTEGRMLDLQFNEDGTATFIVPHLSVGESQVYTLTQKTAPARPASAITLRKIDKTVQVTAPGLPPITYHTHPAPLPRPDIAPVYARGGYIHPVLSPTGRQITDDYPPNHIHHHGIWYAWTKTKLGSIDPDFWNMGQGKGTVEFAKLDATWDGRVHGGWKAQHRHRELMTDQKRLVLEETWEARVYRTPSDADTNPYACFDLQSVQTCVADTALKLPPYHYGGTGIRGNRLWDGKENAFFLTSEGITDRVAGNESRARWCYMGGLVDGQQTGIAILCHPDNYRYPQPVRLHPTEPYFSYAPQQLGEMAIEPGQPYVMQYRHLVFDGPPDRDWLEAQFQDYAHPPAVKLLPD